MNGGRHDLLAGLVQSFAWTTNLMASFFAGSGNPKRAAAAFAARYERQGLLRSALIDCQCVDAGDEPLCASWMEEQNVDRVAYALERRFAAKSKPTRIFWPSENFAAMHGSWTGAASYPCPHKVSHDLIVTSVWLRLLCRSPKVALEQWISEREYGWLMDLALRNGPRPDAQIVDGDLVTAIEIGGNYPAAWLRHHIGRFEAQGWAWEIW